MSRKAIRVGQAEKHGKRWRVAQIDGNGKRDHRYFEGPNGEREARDFVTLFRSQADERSIGQSVTEYLEHLARYGGAKRRPLQGSSLKGVRSKLIGILQLVDPVSRAANRGQRTPKNLPMTDRPLSTLTPSVALRLYADRVKAGVTADTHRSELMYANAWGRWETERGNFKGNPFGEVLPEGTLSAGKAQLGMDEARRFIHLAYTDEHPLGGIAAAAILTLGLRSNELLAREVRDLDDNGKILRVQFGKTESSKRAVAVPPVLRSQLLKLAKGQGPTARLFGSMTDGTLLKHVYRLCEKGGLPVVCTHGLRGTQVSLTVEVGSLVDAASKGAGHADTGVTRRHYLAAGVEVSARARLMEEMLLQDEDTAVRNELEVAEREAREAAEKLAALRAKVALPMGTTPKERYPTVDKPTLTN